MLLLGTADLGRKVTTTTAGLEECELWRPFKAAQGIEPVTGRWEWLVTLASARSLWDGDGKSTWIELAFPTLFVIGVVEERGEQEWSKELGDVFSQEQVWD